MVINLDSAQYYNFIFILLYYIIISSINFVHAATIQEVRIRVVK